MKTPIATYRLQFQPQFGFADAEAIIGYLAGLGISDVYASPIFRARRGSQHGYDGVDPNTLNPELGSEQDWHALVEQLRAHAMGWLQDIVPNHMAFDIDNHLLADVLENGSASRFHDFFDICWEHPREDLKGRLMAPFLGQPYPACLQGGEIRLVYGVDGFAAVYGDLKFPLRIETYRQILDPATASISTALGEDHHDCDHWFQVLDSLGRLVRQRDSRVRQDRVRAVKQRLWDLYQRNSAIRRHISEALGLYDGVPGDIRSYRRLNHLLSQQVFRLCYWQSANQEINYRRFFDINELIALCQESKPVFEHTHARLFELAAGHIVTGIRIDHIDGLAEPAQYLQWLRQRLRDKTYLLVEKILAPEESLPSGWPVQGTTGYDFSHWLNALFVCRENEARFSGIHTRFSGLADTFEEVVTTAKKNILSSRLAGDLDNLARRVKSISSRKRFTSSLTLKRLKQSLVEVLAHLPVYRTYLGSTGNRNADRDVLHTATALAICRRPDLRIEMEFIRDLLLDTPTGDPADEGDPTGLQIRLCVRTFQQLSAALMAKGFEDTAFYRYHRLISLNEVGGEPNHFGCSIDRFHEWIAKRAARWPHAMNCTATHDSKRGEDVRARLNVLSEMPDEWETCLETWHRLTRRHRIRIGRQTFPDKKTEYLLYQTLIGTWPHNGTVTPRYIGRIQAYMQKAVREAGEQSSWMAPDDNYEQALAAFVAGILNGPPDNGFLAAFAPFCRKIAFFGLFNSLSQCLLKITAPGVPDFYQGTELPQLALVDPDNRQAVDFGLRTHLLQTMRSAAVDPLTQVATLLKNRHDGAIKFFVTALALEVRSQLAELFLSGRYIPLTVSGPLRRHLVAFAREGAGQWCMVAVPRFVTALVRAGRDPLGPEVWGDTAVSLPGKAPRSWQNVFTRQTLNGHGRVAAAAALLHLPVALLVGEPSP